MAKTQYNDNIRGRINQEVAVSEWLEISQERINQFADCTLDHQWIHVDEERAVKGPFGETISHGFLTLALLIHFFPEKKLRPSWATGKINYGLNKVRFINPVTVDSKIRCRTVLSAVENKGENRLMITTTHTIEIKGKKRPGCVAQMLSMYLSE